MLILVNAFEIVICQNGAHFVQGRWVQMSRLWPSFCLSHSYQAQQCKTWGYFFSLEYCFIKPYMIFPFQSKCLCSYIYYFSKGGFHPTHHVFKWTNVSHSSKLATSYNCIFAQIYTFWPLLGHRYFSHKVRFLLLVSVTTNVMCMFKFNIYDNG